MPKGHLLVLNGLHVLLDRHNPANDHCDPPDDWNGKTPGVQRTPANTSHLLGFNTRFRLLSGTFMVLNFLSYSATRYLRGELEGYQTIHLKGVRK